VIALPLAFKGAAAAGATAITLVNASAKTNPQTCKFNFRVPITISFPDLDFVRGVAWLGHTFQCLPSKAGQACSFYYWL
jgi:hypothetical protein